MPPRPLALLCVAFTAALAAPKTSLDVLAGLIASRAAADHSQYSRTQLDLLMADLQARLVAPLRAQQFLAKAARFGLPTSDALRFFDNYLVSYERRLKHPLWALEHWDARDLRRRRVMRRRLRVLYQDARLDARHQATDADYRGAPYDRGHMVAVGRNMACAPNCHQTFYATNIVPQCHDLNSGLFFRLENYLEYLAEFARHLYIVTGALYLPPAGLGGLGGPADAAGQPTATLTHRVIGRSRVGVPSHFYKVFVREDPRGRLSMEAFLVANRQGPTRHITLQRHRLDIDRDLPELERAAGMTFFDVLDRDKVDKPRTLHGFLEHLLPDPAGH